MQPRILVVDDEECVRFTFENLLIDEGYHAESAHDYDSAREKMAAQGYDLIFSDIFLGGKTGIDLLRDVRKHDAKAQFVFMTGQPHMDTAVEAVRLGAFDYLPKPFKSETIIRVVRMALQHKALTEEKERYRSNLEAIFRSVSDAIITLDPQLRILELNDAARPVCGLTPAARGKLLTEAQQGCQGVCTPLLREVLSSRQPALHFRLPCGRGESKVATVNISPLFEKGGAFLGSVLVVRDETRLTRMEKGRETPETFHRMVGKSAEMQQVYRMVQAVADLPSTVLITGESGTGKELVADALHHEGVRRQGPFVRVNCAALSENLLESELFGHVKGAFTGALQDRAGRFEKAHGGTIFLDEIGDISPALQVKLLRVLQEKELERVGDTRTVKVDVRVVAATNCDLREKVRCGAFREDLYYRLKVVHISLPPLRQRREDIPLLVRRFLDEFGALFKRGRLGVSDEVMAAFGAYRWPGNVRELQHVLEHAFAVGTGPVIAAEDLPSEIPLAVEERGARPRTGEELLRSALEKAGWNKSKAARLLGVDRRTVYRKMVEYGIEEV